MANIRVCVLFIPLNSKGKSVDHGDSVRIDPESKDEKEEETKFCFGRVFFLGSEQADIYQFLALPIVEEVINGMNGAIITYGQISISDSAEALQSVSTRIANRAVGESQMNMAGSRSHCIYVFSIQHELKNEKSFRKLVLVDLAGSEKAERTGAEGKALKEAKTINKLLTEEAYVDITSRTISLLRKAHVRKLMNAINEVNDNIVNVNNAIYKNGNASNNGNNNVNDNGNVVVVGFN